MKSAWQAYKKWTQTWPMIYTLFQNQPKWRLSLFLYQNHRPVRTSAKQPQYFFPKQGARSYVLAHNNFLN